MARGNGDRSGPFSKRSPTGAEGVIRDGSERHEGARPAADAGDLLLTERGARRRPHSVELSNPAVASTSVPIDVFDAAYAGTERFMGIHEKGRPPWEIGRPQRALVALAEGGLITGRVLDVGCGTGENALYLASRGLEVVGVDASRVAVEMARAKADQRGLTCQFHVGNALELAHWEERFDTTVDTGVLHLFSKADCARLVGGLHHVIRPGGRHHLVCFSRRKPLPAPRRLSRRAITATFQRGWVIERTVECRYEVRDGLSGPNAWAVTLIRL